MGSQGQYRRQGKPEKGGRRISPIHVDDEEHQRDVYEVDSKSYIPDCDVVQHLPPDGTSTQVIDIFFPFVEEGEWFTRSSIYPARSGNGRRA